MSENNEVNRDTKTFWGTGNIGNDDFDFWQQRNKANEPEHDTANKMTYAHGEDAYQPGNPPSLIRVFAVRSMRSTDPRFLHAGNED